MKSPDIERLEELVHLLRRELTEIYGEEPHAVLVVCEDDRFLTLHGEKTDALALLEDTVDSMKDGTIKEKIHIPRRLN